MEDNNLFEKKIQLNHKAYSLKIYIQIDYMILEIESDNNKYSNKYKLEDLINTDNYFRQFDTLQDVLNDFNYLSFDNCKIEEKEASIEFSILNKSKYIKFILSEIDDDDNLDISYDSLSNDMKKIIDENMLILGIDLGTTYSCCGVMIDKKIIIIRNSLGSTTTPSYVSFLSKNDVYVGELAKLLPSIEKNILFSIKRLLGKNLENEEIKEMRKNLPFELIEDADFNLMKIVLNFIDENGKNIKEEFYPEQICSLILKKLVKDSEFYLSKKIGKEIKLTNCVITVPAYFNQRQREATENSAKIIGLNVETMINEPTAASLAYAYQSLENSKKKIIVIDFGGGTLDITFLNYKKDDDGIYCDVNFAYGNTNFGGEDFDYILMKKCIENYSNIYGDNFEIYKDKKNPHYSRLKRACERAKIKLSSFDSTQRILKMILNIRAIISK